MKLTSNKNNILSWFSKWRPNVGQFPIRTRRYMFYLSWMNSFQMIAELATLSPFSLYLTCVASLDLLPLTGHSALSSQL